MLQLQIEVQKATKPGLACQKLQSAMQKSKGDSSDSGDMIIDTSDVMSSDYNSAGEEEKQGAESSETLSTFHKLRQLAMLCLQNLFRIASRALYNFWCILFPSFMMKSQSPFTHFLF